MVFAEVGNLIRRKNKNSHCAGETERGLREAGVCGTPGWGKVVHRGARVRGWEGEGLQILGRGAREA